jgi:hypothetical protein
MARQELWLNDSIQFPRLLAEINSVGLTRRQMSDLCASMDLEPQDIDELFDRAENAWTAHKQRHVPPEQRIRD